MTPTHYIVSNDRKSATAKAQMEKPPYHAHDYDHGTAQGRNLSEFWGNKQKEYAEHIASLSTIILSPELSEIVSAGQEISSEEVRLEYQVGDYKHPDEPMVWSSCSELSYREARFHGVDVRILAHPLKDAGEEKSLTPEDVLDMFFYRHGKSIKDEYPEIYKAAILAMKKYAAEEVLEYAKADPSEALQEIIEICSNEESSIELIAKVEKIAEQALSTPPLPSQPEATELEQAFLRRALDTYRKTGGNVTVMPNVGDADVSKYYEDESPSASTVGVQELAKELKLPLDTLKSIGEYDQGGVNVHLSIKAMERVVAALAGHTAAEQGGKGVEEKFHAVEFSGFWAIKTEPYYDAGEDILNADSVGEKEAEEYANLIVELLNKHYAKLQ